MNIFFNSSRSFTVHPGADPTSCWNCFHKGYRMDLYNKENFRGNFHVQMKESITVGSRSEVLQAHSKGKKWALKKPNLRYANFFLSEAKMLKYINKQEKSANQEYFVQLIGVLTRRGQAMMLMKFCEGGNLYARVKEAPIGIALESVEIITKQMLKALGFLRDNKIIHREIKLSSILIESGDRVKLGDFALSMREDDENNRFIFCGTLSSLSPELLLANNQEKSPIRYPYGSSSDMWAAAISMLKALGHLDLFENMDLGWEEQKKIVRDQQRDLPKVLEIEIQKMENSLKSAHFYTALKEMLKINPKERPSPEAVLTFLDQEESTEIKTLSIDHSASLLGAEDPLPSPEKFDLERKRLLLDLDHIQMFNEVRKSQKSFCEGNGEKYSLVPEDWDYECAYPEPEILGEEKQTSLPRVSLSRDEAAWSSLCRRQGLDPKVLAATEKYLEDRFPSKK